MEPPFHWVRKDSIFGEILESLDEPWNSILYDFHISVMKRPADEFDVRLRIQLPAIKDLILNGSYNRVFDFLQFIVRHSLVPDGFGAFVAATLHECSCAYSLTTIEGVWTIMPTAIPEQRISVEKALRVLTDGPFGGAREHLRKSVDCINTGDYSGSVRESIHAVESVARRLDSNARTLSGALASLAERGLVLHGAFKSGIKQLYGYASDEDGIRHSLSDATANVDVADAVFMFGACASFAAFLVEKVRVAGIPIEE